MTRLTVLYDPKCGLCSASAGWLAGQRQLVPLDLLPNDGGSKIPAGDLAVIADSGEVWRGSNAWIMTLWALDGYRTLAEDLAGSAFAPLARRIFENVSKNREALSGLLGLTPEVCKR